MINTFSHVPGYKINVKKSVTFIYNKNKEAEEGIRQFSFIVVAKNKISIKPSRKKLKKTP
jgi:hypothetical protein